MQPDADGDCTVSGTTQELMTGNTSVRVLITLRTPKVDAVRLLKKLLNDVESKYEPEPTTESNAKVETAQPNPIDLSNKECEESLPF
jgi:hypothetical protein